MSDLMQKSADFTDFLHSDKFKNLPPESKVNWLRLEICVQKLKQVEIEQKMTQNVLSLTILALFCAFVAVVMTAIAFII